MIGKQSDVGYFLSQYVYQIGIYSHRNIESGNCHHRVKQRKRNTEFTKRKGDFTNTHVFVNRIKYYNYRQIYLLE